MRQNIVNFSLVIWLLFPLLLYGLLKILITDESAFHSLPGLFLIYLALTWTITLLIFILETGRRQLFKPQGHMACALRLGVYGIAATAVSLAFVPRVSLLPIASIGILLCTSFILATGLGSLYWRQLPAQRG